MHLHPGAAISRVQKEVILAPSSIAGSGQGHANLDGSKGGGTVHVGRYERGKAVRCMSRILGLVGLLILFH